VRHDYDLRRSYERATGAKDFAREYPNVKSGADVKPSAVRSASSSAATASVRRPADAIKGREALWLCAVETVQPNP
jgi:hypothetical protein